LAGECPSRDFGPDGGLDEIPGAGDLATDDDLRGIERVDDRREAEPEITARFRQCGAGPLIAGAGADDDVIHGDAVLWEQRRGDGRRLLVPDVAPDRAGLPPRGRPSQSPRSVPPSPGFGAGGEPGSRVRPGAGPG